MSLLNVNTIEPSTGTDITLGASGDTITVPSGATFTQSGTMNASAITAGTMAIARGGTGAATFAAAGLSNAPAFQAFMAGNQTISATTYTIITFDTEDYDSDGCYNHTSGTVTLNGISTPAYSFAPNVAGKYLIGAAVNSNTGTDFDTFLVSIFKNGTQINRVINSSRHYDTAMTSFIVTANGTSDYFDIQCYTEQSGGSTLQPTDSSSRLMWFSGTRIIGA